MKTYIKKQLACIRHWLKYRRWCSWCGKAIGGNPFAKQKTHGICPSCQNKMIECI